MLNREERKMINKYEQLLEGIRENIEQKNFHNARKAISVLKTESRQKIAERREAIEKYKESIERCNEVIETMKEILEVCNAYEELTKGC